MNYVREELLRQRAVLAALMLGDAEAAAARDAAEAESRAVQRESCLWEAELPGWGALRDDSTGTRSGRNRSGEPAEREARSPCYGETAPEMARRNLALGRPDAGETSGGQRIAAPGQTSARGVTVQMLSRAIQQDARRYDGGFSIY